jgi:hypothetical protein
VRGATGPQRTLRTLIALHSSRSRLGDGHLGKPCRPGSRVGLGAGEQLARAQDMFGMLTRGEQGGVVVDGDVRLSGTVSPWPLPQEPISQRVKPSINHFDRRPSSSDQLSLLRQSLRLPPRTA